MVVDLAKGMNFSALLSHGDNRPISLLIIYVTAKDGDRRGRVLGSEDRSQPPTDYIEN
jgi:hypothetical protein